MTRGPGASGCWRTRGSRGVGPDAAPAFKGYEASSPPLSPAPGSRGRRRLYTPPPHPVIPSDQTKTSSSGIRGLLTRCVNRNIVPSTICGY